MRFALAVIFFLLSMGSGWAEPDDKVTQHIERMTEYATWAQAGISLLTLVIAIAAAFSWYETLISQRSDECVGAAIYFQSSVGRYLSAIAGSAGATAAYDEAWNAQAKLSQALAIQKRYNDFPGDDIDRRAYELMNSDIAPTFRAGKVDSASQKKINEECAELVRRVKGQLRPGWIMRTFAMLRARAIHKRA